MIRLAVAVATASLTACSIWAAIDDPYKNDQAPTEGPHDASLDAHVEAGPPAVSRVDAGFIPYAIAAHGDAVYVVDNAARVHVAYDAGTQFTTFWAGDGGDTFLPTNRIAASADNVCWTVTSGVRCCAADGGPCALLESANAPTSIAANDPVVAWIDGTGVRVCTRPLAVCAPSTLAGSKGAQSVAAGPGGSVAWTGGGQTLHLSKGQANTAIDLPYQVSLVATEGTSDNLYWQGQDAVGSLHFDGTASTHAPVASPSKPTQLFVARGFVYWSLASGSLPTSISYCRFDSTTMTCSPRALASGAAVAGRAMNFGIAANSRDVLTIVSSVDDAFPPELLMWRLP